MRHEDIDLFGPHLRGLHGSLSDLTHFECGPTEYRRTLDT
ncbi:Uncharacterised protein [Mycobacteroides abscessus subsp. abscessus]|nr:Uncharacterised protein [Mycobacteroides abscessus subsp. abscessus]